VPVADLARLESQIAQRVGAALEIPICVKRSAAFERAISLGSDGIARPSERCQPPLGRRIFGRRRILTVDRDDVIEMSEKIAAAIGRRDTTAMRGLLAPGFVHRTHGGPAAGLEAFLHGIEQIPGEILAVRLDRLEVDVTPAGALVTGVQHARVRVDGQVIEDRRGFVDWFVKQNGEWRIQAGVDLPPPDGARQVA
jgi:hypothetical protein